MTLTGRQLMAMRKYMGLSRKQFRDYVRRAMAVPADNTFPSESLIVKMETSDAIKDGRDIAPHHAAFFQRAIPPKVWRAVMDKDSPF